MRARKTFFLFFVSFVATVIFIAVLAVVVIGVSISNSDLIFPNVSVEGIDLSGMTVAQAKDRLFDMGIEDNAAFVAVTVNFPDGSGFSISGNDAGFSLCAEKAALAAFRHGRDGSFLEGVHTFVTSLLFSADVNVVRPVLDEDFVRDKVSAYTRQFNGSLIERPSYSVDGYNITIVTDSGFVPAAESSVFRFVSQALHDAWEEGSHHVVYYAPTSTGPFMFDLNALYHRLHTEPRSAAFAPLTFVVQESVTGVSFDINAASNLLANAPRGEQIVIPLIHTEPEITTEYLQGRLFRDELATRTTRVDGTAARLTNVTIAASHVDGMVLNPGGVFSFNGTVGRSTEARGFLPAGGFRDGQLVDMVGGGICQVASSIYDNVLHAHLEVVARRAHTLPVFYLPHGQDASIYYGVLDFRFRNNTNYPIRIEVELDGRDLTSRILGTRNNDNVIRIESNSTAVPFDTVYRAYEGVAHGESIVYFSGRNGVIAYTYRRIYDAEGNRISRTRIARDVYRTQNRVVLVHPSAPQLEIQAEEAEIS